MNSVEALLANKVFTDFLGSRFIEHYAALRLHEFERYECTISDWERKEYFHLF
ncbi:hypothetical protein [Aneurinibacillus aneurinilyticus]|jgi:glutamine synthetase|uniref:Glutamine synthetase n=1 Tax=Aneurinibacillus aneurinilyticus TaxID=1391 RepID=A0A848CRR9_ANEAE|nr:hypothetical protein [Aneurinibacillus aneurinilyticus]MED0672058.1 hypothetical protein [Aneurinibacillus aneurinilyticus]NMF00185.1 glutamine synthetase [Aneurinibacillus aneurinilyticus]